MPIHPFWIAVILAIVLIVFGPGRLADIGGAAGRAVREFRRATANEVKMAAPRSESSVPPAGESGTSV